MDIVAQDIFGFVHRLRFRPIQWRMRLMVAALRKFPAIKQWTALILFAGICSWLLTVAVENYREYRSFERTFDSLASECTQQGGCNFPGYRY